MKVLGIVAEYNPFHKGHLHHLVESKRLTGATHSVAVMSGHFTQRGEPAIADKWTRAAMAVDNGVDLVIELPALYASSSAEYFGEAGIRLLDALGVVEVVTYGSETGNQTALSEAAECLLNETPVFKAALKEALDEGSSFPLARARALAEQKPELAGILDHSNNILAIEYLKAADRIGSTMAFEAVKRIGPDYNDANLETGGFSSASAIRRVLAGSGVHAAAGALPAASVRWLDRFERQAGGFPEMALFYPFIRYRVMMSEHAGLKAVSGMREGLENVLKKAVHTCGSYQDFMEEIRSKRYPQSSLQRLMVHLLLDSKAERLEVLRSASGTYARILGIGPGGRAILRRAKTGGAECLLTNINRRKPARPLSAELLSYDLRSTDLYMLALSSMGVHARGRQDHLKRPYIGTDS